MRVWLDDQRPLPPDYDSLVLTAADAIALLQSGHVTHISLDHDLGPVEAGTGYDVAKWIEEQAYQGTLPRISWAVHSANPIGAFRITRALESANRFWTMREQNFPRSGLVRAKVRISAKKFTKDEANAIAAELGIDFEKVDFDLEQFFKGLNVELEHGTKTKKTDVSGDDPLMTGKIAWAHLLELPDYYDRLTAMEQEAEQEQEAAGTKEASAPKLISVNGYVYERVAVSGRELNPRQLADKIEMYTKDILQRMQTELTNSITALKASVQNKDEDDLPDTEMSQLRSLEERCNSLYEDAWTILDDMKQYGNGKPVKPEPEEIEEEA